ncbi:TPA: hypothetical protein ACGO1T_001029 [Streptococcus suis]
MVYLMQEWLVDPMNETIVRELLVESSKDMKDESSKSDEDVISILTKLGELKIAEMLNEGWKFN